MDIIFKFNTQYLWSLDLSCRIFFSYVITQTYPQPQLFLQLFGQGHDLFLMLAHSTCPQVIPSPEFLSWRGQDLPLTQLFLQFFIDDVLYLGDDVSFHRLEGMGNPFLKYFYPPTQEFDVVLHDDHVFGDGEDSGILLVGFFLLGLRMMGLLFVPFCRVPFVDAIFGGQFFAFDWIGVQENLVEIGFELPEGFPNNDFDLFVGFGDFIDVDDLGSRFLLKLTVRPMDVILLVVAAGYPDFNVFGIGFIIVLAQKSNAGNVHIVQVDMFQGDDEVLGETLPTAPDQCQMGGVIFHLPTMRPSQPLLHIFLNQYQSSSLIIIIIYPYHSSFSSSRSKFLILLLSQFLMSYQSAYWLFLSSCLSGSQRIGCSSCLLGATAYLCPYLLYSIYLEHKQMINKMKIIMQTILAIFLLGDGQLFLTGQVSKSQRSSFKSQRKSESSQQGSQYIPQSQRPKVLHRRLSNMFACMILAKLIQSKIIAKYQILDNSSKEVLIKIFSYSSTFSSSFSSLSLLQTQTNAFFSRSFSYNKVLMLSSQHFIVQSVYCGSVWVSCSWVLLPKEYQCSSCRCSIYLWREDIFYKCSFLSFLQKFISYQTQTNFFSTKFSISQKCLMSF